MNVSRAAFIMGICAGMYAAAMLVSGQILRRFCMLHVNTVRCCS